MAPQITDQEWYSIAEHASKEMDPKKLLILVDQLCCALNERDRRRREIYGSAANTRTPLPAGRESSVSEQ